MRVAIVNDSVMAVESMRRIVVSGDELEIAWIAANGKEAVASCAKDVPDLILMDLLMPEMDGVEATRQIMRNSPCSIVVVTATVEGNAAKVFNAMGAGALDAVNTPVLGLSGSGAGRKALLDKIYTVRKLLYGNVRTKGAATQRAAAKVENTHEHLIAIGASTGGPAALADVLAMMPADLPAAVALIQHVDAEFAPSFADWLNQQTKLPVRIAEEGDRLEKGVVLVAGRDAHLVLNNYGYLTYSDEPREYAYRPSVNEFFNSIAENWKGNAAGVLLTGMGRDGAAGLLALKQRGFYTIAQNKESCAVYGMPKAAAEIDAAVEILPIQLIGPALTQIDWDDVERKSA